MRYIVIDSVCYRVRVVFESLNRRRMINQYNESQAINQIKIISEVRIK